MNVLSPEERTDAIACLVDGCGIRATERLTGITKKTVSRYLLTVGQGCARLHDRIMRHLPVSLVQLDEQWGWVGKRPVRITPDDPPEFGEQWTFVALAVASRAVVSYRVGKRDEFNTKAFITDLHRRLAPGTPTIQRGTPAEWEAERDRLKPHIVSDGFKPYRKAIHDAFGNDVHFGQLVKQFADPNRPGELYAQGEEPKRKRHKKGEPPAEMPHRLEYKQSITVPIIGHPPMNEIRTSYVERVNLTARQGMRRFARKTTGYSKSLVHHRAAVALHFAHYNLCRIHETLNVTPAMALGVADSLWTIDKLIEIALRETQPEPLPPRYAPDLGPPPQSAHEAGKRKFSVIKGGRS